MSGLPWVRLDSNCYSHDKTLWLLAQRDGYRAWSVYTFSLGYSGGHGTDGMIPRHVLPAIHGTERIAVLLVEARLWEHAEGGWKIRNWDQRQEMSMVTAAKKEAKRQGARRTNCQRYHGHDCGCWRDSDADIVPLRRSHEAR
jgi:hypothetical protein